MRGWLVFVGVLSVLFLMETTNYPSSVFQPSHQGDSWIQIQLNKSSLSDRLQSPSLRKPLFWFGTDSLGRSQLLRMLQATPLTLALGLCSAGLAIALGGFMGLGCALTSRSRFVFEWWILLFQSVPSVLIAAWCTLVVGRSSWTLIFAVALSSWAPLARLVESEVRGILSQPYVEASRALGATEMQTFWAQVLPNLMNTALIGFLVQIPNAILQESLLSFLGVGIEPPLASWGTLANEGIRAFPHFPHLLLVPGFAIFLAVACFQKIAARYALGSFATDRAPLSIS